jgi:hypothetical protein
MNHGDIAAEELRAAFQRVAIGNIRTYEQDLVDLWDEVRRCRDGLIRGGS